MMPLRSVGVRIGDRLPSVLAARLRGDSGAAALLRPIANRFLPAGPAVVEVRSGYAFGIRLEILPRSEKYYWLGTYEPLVVREIARRLRPGGTYWDVGSHVGYLVAVASRLVGPAGTVVAFEPNPENLRRLRRTIELNGLENVTVREIALSDHVGESEFFVSDASSMGSLLPGASSKATLMVRTSTIDEELKTTPYPDLVKIDVEGGETVVLAGAGQMLGRHRTDLIVEVLSPDQQTDVAKRLMGYRTSMLDDRNMLALPSSYEAVSNA